MLGIGLGLVLGLFSALLGDGHLCLTGCRNGAPSKSHRRILVPFSAHVARGTDSGLHGGRVYLLSKQVGCVKAAVPIEMPFEQQSLTRRGDFMAVSPGIKSGRVIGQMQIQGGPTKRRHTLMTTILSNLNPIKKNNWKIPW